MTAMAENVTYCPPPNVTAGEEGCTILALDVIDWVVLGGYMIGLIVLSVFLGRGQKNKEDYYVGGRSMPWWTIAISVMATQTSAISFISIPAFVAMKTGGGLTWLQYELGVPLAMVLVAFLLIPYLRSLEIVSVYEYLQLRYGPVVRYAMSVVFLLSRGMGTGVGLYASAIVLQVCLGTSLTWTIVIMGVVTIIYDSIGGLKTVVYSDVIQMGVLVGGLVLCVAFAIAGSEDGVAAMMTEFPTERLRSLEISSGIGCDGGGLADCPLEEGTEGKRGGDLPFFAFLFGGICLYMSYYGTDQSQVQRQLASKTTDDAKRTLIFNGVARFPLTLLYCLLGWALGTFVGQREDVRALAMKPDYLVPVFVLLKVPTGLRAILFAALLSAAMSSLDSSLNSLSAVTMEDFVLPSLRYCKKRGQNDSPISADEEGDEEEAAAEHSGEDNAPLTKAVKERVDSEETSSSLPSTSRSSTPNKQKKKAFSDKLILLGSKLMTVLWGVLISVFAMFSGSISDTVIESINKVGSAFYGPSLGVFLLGILSTRVRTVDVLVGLIGGVGLNVAFWLSSAPIMWMWWNLTGLVATASLALFSSLLSHRCRPRTLPAERLLREYTIYRGGQTLRGLVAAERKWMKKYLLLVLYFVVIVTLMAVTTALLQKTEIDTSVDA